ncbi:FAD-linked oxidoreductase-like protein [Crepidotus variabilis]|uniref:Proline dehydrogenase n=1 Tax=Crepidotus variabilis TaxID=179855 RepID=A0A9P6EIT5_9AGAR|nr:FAD-linked oxidoreductase-like protein [Crepidotus variabilis]
MVRAYVVYSICSIPWLVDSAPDILQRLSSLPVIKQITEGLVRVTFFKQFVGADTAEECVPLLHSLRQANKGALLVYSVEVDENEITRNFVAGSASISHSDNPQKRIIDEMIHSVDVVANFEANLHDDAAAYTSASSGKSTWVAIKLTALLPDPNALVALSSYIVNSRKLLSSSAPESAVPFPGAARPEDLDLVIHPSANSSCKDKLSSEHIQQLKGLYDDLVRICTRAKERGVKVTIDAEYSWYQPAIDALTLALMREFNSLSTSSTPTPNQPLVYGTFQAYLRRTPMHIAVALADAKKHNYALGVKLVRGAYHPYEISAHDNKANGGGLSISPDREPPVWQEKAETDKAYDDCVRMLIEAVKEDIGRCSKEGTSSRSVPNANQERGNGWLSGLTAARRSTPPQNEPELRRSVPSVGVLFGTHNWKSCGLVLDEIVKNGLGTRVSSRTGGHLSSTSNVVRLDDEVVDRIAIGQLYGMSDDLSDWIVSRTISSSPLVIKYMPYGALADVMPYLSRRAVENKSVLGEGGATNERRRAAREIRRRLFG